MFQITEKAIYDKQIAPLKNAIEVISIYIAKIKKELMLVNDLDLENKTNKTLEVIDLIFKETCYQITICITSINILNFKNEAYLDLARKNCISIVNYLESLVGNEIDIPPAQLAKGFSYINNKISNLEQFEKIKRFGFTIDRLKNLSGENSKWKWSLVDLEGSFIRAMKNMVDFPNLIKNLNPAIPKYAERMNMLNLVTSKLDEAAELYRNKYELTQKQVSDMKKALAFVAFHRRLHILLGEKEQAEILKKKYQTWDKKLQQDLEEKK